MLNSLLLILVNFPFVPFVTSISSIENPVVGSLYFILYVILFAFVIPDILVVIVGIGPVTSLFLKTVYPFPSFPTVSV